MKRFLRGLPVYINGFVVTLLAINNPKAGALEVFLWLSAGVTFVWYGINMQNSKQS